MKKYFSQDRPHARFAIQQLAGGLAIVAGISMLLAGCSKAKAPSNVANTPPPAQSTNPEPAAAAPDNPQLPPTAVADTTTNGQPDFRGLNRQFISYEVQNRCHFKTIEEYAAAANVQFPPPPAGKKYALDKKGYIALVDR